MSENKIIEIFNQMNIKVNKIETANNSFNSNVYIIYDDNNNKYIFKILNNELKRLTEQKYYNYLYNYIPTSKVIQSGSINGKEYNIITFFEGKNLYDEDCNKLSSKQIYNIGRLLANIHNCKIIEDDNDSWLIYLNCYINDAYNNLSPLIGSKDNEIISSFLKKYIENKIINNYKNCILHMDFRIGNIMFKNEDNIGVIDLESMRNGDYVFDFVKMSKALNKENFNIFLQGYKSIRKIDDSFYNKLNFYTFFDSYTSLCWCVRKGRIDSSYYKENNTIMKKYLRKIKNGKWNI